MAKLVCGVVVLCLLVVGCGESGEFLVTSTGTTVRDGEAWMSIAFHNGTDDSIEVTGLELSDDEVAALWEFSIMGAQVDGQAGVLPPNGDDVVPLPATVTADTIGTVYFRVWSESCGFASVADFDADGNVRSITWPSAALFITMGDGRSSEATSFPPEHLVEELFEANCR